jgi:hypothetical protein
MSKPDRVTRRAQRAVKDRCARARNILCDYARRTGDVAGFEEDPGTPMRDILTDFMHFCDEEDLPFQQETERAVEFYREECIEADIDPDQYAY